MSVNSEKIVQLFILSRDRCDYCREAVSSAIAQTSTSHEVIISDNSIGSDVSIMLAREFPFVKVIRRNPTMPALAHFNCLIKEATAEFVVLFHDDDILDTCYVERMLALFKENPEVSAIGCNANIVRGNFQTKKKMMGDFKGSKILYDVNDFIFPYLSLVTVNPAPFPGYMYRTRVIRSLSLERDSGGKHADVSFLCNIVLQAPILWIDEVLFKYRIHAKNDSVYESITDRLRWLGYVYSVTNFSPKSIAVRDYKFLYWWRWVHQCISKSGLLRAIITINNRKLVALKFITFYGFSLIICRKHFWRRFYNLSFSKLTDLFG